MYLVSEGESVLVCFCGRYPIEGRLWLISELGAHLAEMSLVLNITNILAVFDITKAVDGSGVEIEPEIVWSTGVTSFVFSLNRATFP